MYKIPFNISQCNEDEMRRENDWIEKETGYEQDNEKQCIFHK